MSALERLAERLEVAMDSALARPWETSDAIDRCLAEMIARADEGESRGVPVDLQKEALERFWSTRTIESRRDARRLSFGLIVPRGAQDQAIIEDHACFTALIDAISLVQSRPRAFAGCYRGLLHAYFHYDPAGPSATVAGKENWEALRDYLNQQLERVVVSNPTSTWVTLLHRNRELLSAEPCLAYGDSFLDGDDAAVKELRTGLAISASSWFSRALILSAVNAATRRSDSEFNDRIRTLVGYLRSNEIVRDAGLAKLLDRYVHVRPARQSLDLRDAAVDWWRNPWLPSNRSSWSAVSPAARDMVAGWLKLEFVEGFFNVLAEERSGDRRRLEFWKRYVKSIDNVVFALGSQARESRAPDLVELRRRIAGLEVELRDPVRVNNAFVMRMGKVTVVEFSAEGNACYFYDSSTPLPFDTAKPVAIAVDAPNSLKCSRYATRLRHKDMTHGFERWEERFEAELRQRFQLEPQSTAWASELPRPHRLVGAANRPRQVGARPSGVSERRAMKGQVRSYSRQQLDAFAAKFQLQVVDLSSRNGNLWVRTDDSRPAVNSVLRAWGFSYRPSKGWWR